MNQSNAHFLEFSGKKIYFTRINGIYWIVIKSVCEALEVNFNRQYQNMRDDKILRSKFAKQQILIPGDTQPRKYVCIPEKYVYGWIFSIKSDSDELWTYKEDCYEALYNTFHKVITKRAELYGEIAKATKELNQCKNKLKDNDDFIRKEELEMKIARLWKNVRNRNKISGSAGFALRVGTWFRQNNPHHGFPNGQGSELNARRVTHVGSGNLSRYFRQYFARLA